MKRVKTGIKGVDDLIEGGIPDNSSILVTGAPGTGKTIFALEFLYRGATKFNEPGLYISMEETTEDLKNQAQQFGWDFDKLEESGKITFLTIPTDVYNLDLIESIRLIVLRTGARRIVFDSLSVLTMNSSIFQLPLGITDDSNLVQIEEGITPSAEHIIKENETFVYSFIYRVHRFNVTTLFTADSPGDGKLTKDGVSEFVCDGVFNLEMKEFGKTVVRTLEVRKMRSSKITPGFNTLNFTKTGVQVSPFKY